MHQLKGHRPLFKVLKDVGLILDNHSEYGLLPVYFSQQSTVCQHISLGAD